MRAGPFSVIDIKRDKQDSGWAFVCVIHTAMGPVHLRGFKLHDNGKLLSTRINYGIRQFPVVVLTPHQRAAIKRLALRCLPQAPPTPLPHAFAAGQSVPQMSALPASPSVP